VALAGEAAGLIPNASMLKPFAPLAGATDEATDVNDVNDVTDLGDRVATERGFFVVGVFFEVPSFFFGIVFSVDLVLAMMPLTGLHFGWFREL